MAVTYERVRELFSYRFDGMLVWKVDKGKRTKKGDVAGTINNHGYCIIYVDREGYPAHRIIYLWHHGYMPEGELDHINRIKRDNRIENLREVSRLCNVRNTGNFKNNTSGVKGIYKYQNLSKWFAYIKVSSRAYRLGTFNNLDEAVLTRLAAEQCLDWDACNSNSPAYQYAVEHGLIKLPKKA